MKSLYTVALYLFLSFPIFPSNIEICNSLDAKHTTLQNAIQYYKAEKYLESEIELSRLLLEFDCDSVRIFKIFTLLKQGKELEGTIRKTDFQDIRFRILYGFSNLIQNRNDPLQNEIPSSCFYPDCKLEKLEEAILFLSAFQNFDQYVSKDTENTNTNLDKLKELWEKEKIRIRKKSKNPYLSAFLSVILPGSGQIYSNQFAEGITSGFVNFVLISASYAVYLVNPMSLVFYVLSGSTLMIYSSNVVGAYAAANRNNNFWKYQAMDDMKREVVSLRILEQEIFEKIFKL